MNELEIVKWEKPIEGKREVYVHVDSEISQSGGRLFFLVESEDEGELGKAARQAFCKELLANFHSFSEIKDTRSHLFSAIQKANQALLEYFEENDIPGHKGLMVLIMVAEGNKLFHFQVGTQLFVLWRDGVPTYLGSRIDTSKPPTEAEISLRESMCLPVQSLNDDQLEVRETELQNGDILIAASSNLTLALSDPEHAHDLIEDRTPSEIRDEIKRAVEALSTPYASAALCMRANVTEAAPKTKPKVSAPKITMPKISGVSPMGGKKAFFIIPGIVAVVLLIFVIGSIFMDWGYEESNLPPEESSVHEPIVTDIDKPASQAVWEFNAGQEISSSPYVDGDLVYFGCKDNYIYALNVKTGKLVWRYRTEDGIGSSPVTSDSLLFIGSYDYNLYALDKFDGNLAWRYRTDARIIATPAVSGNTVFVGSNDYRLHAVSILSGERAWAIKTQNLVWASPLIFNNRLYFASVDGYLYCSSLGGDPIWKIDIGRGTYGLYSSPAAEGSNIYLGSKDGSLYAVDWNSGEIKWSYQTGGIIRSSPEVSNGKIYFGSEDGNVYCLTADGAEFWVFTTGGSVNSSPYVQNGIVYIGSDDDQLYALDAVSGQKRWSHDMGSNIYSSPFVANGMVYVGSEAGLLKAVSTGGF